MDGNFSAEHMRYRTSEKDIALSPGMAFMASPDQYKSHLRSGAEIVQVSAHLFISFQSQLYHSPAPVTHTGR
jgi:hypothetical protein